MASDTQNSGLKKSKSAILKKKVPRWHSRVSKSSTRGSRSFEERLIDVPLTEEIFDLKAGEEAWLEKLTIAPEVPSFELRDTLKMHRVLAAREGAARRREVLHSPKLSPEEKQNQIYLLYKRASEDAGYHPKTMRVGPKNLRWLAELALAHKRTLDYVLDRIVEAARYGIRHEIKAEICARSASAIAGLKYRRTLEGLAADLIREELRNAGRNED